jgi:hypothetical protein
MLKPKLSKSETQERKELYDLLDFSDAKKQVILSNLIDTQILSTPSIDVSNDVYKDTSIDKWCATLPTLDGSKLLIKRLVCSPTNDKETLLARQNQYFKDHNIDFSILKDYEDDVLWIYKLNDEVKSNNLIHTLFPSTFLISYINYVEPLIELYHLYKIYFIPLNIIGYPILSLFAPLYYVNNYLGFSLSLQAYLKIMWKIVRYIFTFTGDIKSTLIRIVSVFFYVFLFFYNIYQTLEYSYMIYNVKSTLFKKISNLNTFLKEATRIIQDLPVNVMNVISPFVNVRKLEKINVGSDFPSIYKLWKDNQLKAQISDLLVVMYTLDIVNSISNLINNCNGQSNWCLPVYTDGSSKLWNMRNPILPPHQTANPANLSKNIVITGPNAAGKTTYVKSILSNIILSQTFGITYALQSQTVVYDSIISFMRISDVLGSKSYFEAEAEYCLKMMEKARELSQRKMRGLFLMDEPMHSTPPTEGMATAYAVAEYIGHLSGATVILTTHFHKLMLLEKEYPDKFMNLSVEAIPLPDNRYRFPYHIMKGASHQCIAIELLSTKQYPVTVINCAINMKNKICSEILDKVDS